MFACRYYSSVQKGVCSQLAMLLRLIHQRKSASPSEHLSRENRLFNLSHPALQRKTPRAFMCSNKALYLLIVGEGHVLFCLMTPENISKTWQTCSICFVFFQRSREKSFHSADMTSRRMIGPCVFMTNVNDIVSHDVQARRRRAALLPCGL